MEAKAKGQFYASRYETERVEEYLRKKKWYITEGGPDFSVYESKSGGKIKMSQIPSDAYKGYNIEIINSDNPAALAAQMNKAGNIDIDYIIKLSGIKGRPKFAEHFKMSKRTIENYSYGNTKTPEYILHMLERIIREDQESVDD